MGLSDPIERAIAGDARRGRRGYRGRPDFRGRAGYTRVEILVLVLVIALLAVMFYLVVPRVRKQSMVDVEAGNLRGIHQSWVIFAGEYDGQFPVPGAMKRTPVQRDGDEVVVPARGAIDITQNTTANLYSACIMLNYITPELCVGPAEPSDHVRVMTNDTYDWSSYSPVDGVYWDANFRADLHGVSNVSYAHLPLCGVRYERQWRDSAEEGFPLLGHRGPKDGEAPGSITLRIFPPFDAWRGVVVNGDNSSSLRDTMLRSEIKLDVDGQLVPDSIFRMEEGPGGADAILTFTKAMTPDGPVTDWD